MIAKIHLLMIGMVNLVFTIAVKNVQFTTIMQGQIQIAQFIDAADYAEKGAG